MSITSREFENEEFDPTFFEQLPKTRENEKFRINYFKKGTWMSAKSFLSYAQFVNEKLTRSDLLYVFYIHQFPMYNVMWIMFLSEKNGTVTTLILFTLVQSIVCTPIFMLYCFMGMYTKRGYIMFWNSMPIFKGMGYALAIHEFLGDVYNVSDFTSMGLIYLYTTITSDMPWKNCRFKYPESVGCRKLGSEDPMNCSTPTGFASAIYYRHVILDTFAKFGSDHTVAEIGSFQISRIIAIIITCIFLLVCVIRGIENYQKTLRKFIKAAIGYLLFCFLWVIIFAVRLPQMTVLNNSYKITTDMKAWTDTINVAIDRNGPGSIIYLASLAHADVGPSLFAIQVSIVKIIVVLMLLIFQVYCKRSVIHVYNFPMDAKCVYMQGGKDIIFGAMADLISFLPAYRLFLLFYYASLFIISFSSTYYITVAFLHSVLQDQPKLGKYRGRMSIIMCVFMAIASIPFCSQSGSAALGTVYFYVGIFVMKPLLFCIITMLLTFLYTTQNIEADYEFIYRQLPFPLWTSFWKLSPIFLMFLVVATLFNTSVNRNVLQTMYLSYVYVCNAITLLPVVLVLLYFYYKKLKKTHVDSFIKPNSLWGMPSVTSRNARNSYNPEKDIKRRSKLRCSHNCLVKDKKLKNESMQRKLQFEILKECLEGDKYYRSSMSQDTF